MRTRTLALLLSLILFHLSWPFAQASAQLDSSLSEIKTTSVRVPAPEDVLGFRPGDDRRLASWKQVVEYFQKLDAASDRVKFEELGRSTMNAPFVMATISAPENLARLDEFKDIQRQLADPRTLGPNPDRKAAQLIARSKTVVLITCGIHSNEVGSYLSGMLIAHRLASSDEPLVQEILRNCIVLLVPSLNPDGVDIVKNWYDKTLGTPYEGTDPPVLYHKYTGHDDNRDWYAFTQVETQITVDKIHNVWHPQIVHDIHQQGAYGSRLFLPPYMPPVEPNVPRQIVEGYTELGRAMATELRAAGFKGITTDSTYDAWTPARAYSHYHGGVRILSETASCKLATPINVKFDELRPGEGYDPQKESDKFSPLWPGGEWHLRDITNYMTTAAFALLRHAAQNRERWLSRFYEIGKEAVRPRKDGELQGFKLTNIEMFEKELLEILDRGRVQYYHRFGESKTDTATYTPRYYVIPFNQPYGNFAKALLENQTYPNLKDAEGNPIPPYDVTAHTLSLLMNVKVENIYTTLPIDKKQKYSRSADLPFEAPSYSFDTIYKSDTPSIDEGWTRWVFEKTKTGYFSITTKDITNHLEFTERTSPLLPSDPNYSSDKIFCKSIIFPDNAPNQILNGYTKGTMPDDYTGGLGGEGVKALRKFVEAGGTLIFLNRASAFAIEQFKLPVRDITEGLKRTEFYAPGSILRIELDKSHPVTKGMPEQSIAWVENSPVFEISDPKEAARVRIIARYPASENPLLSGWLLGGERIRGKAALVEVTLGRGRIYLFGFRPQYRGQSLATYPLFFNAITR